MRGSASKVVTDLAVDAAAPKKIFKDLQSVPILEPQVECKYDLRLTTMDFGESEPQQCAQHVPS